MRSRVLAKLLPMVAVSSIAAASAPGASGAFYSHGLIPGDIPQQITDGPDGNVWFVTSGNHSTNYIGKITPAGAITMFTQGITDAADITGGHDGNVWYTAVEGAIGRITPTGAVTEFQQPADSPPGATISAGPDGNVWFPMGRAFARVSPAGAVTPFPETTLCATTDMAPGPDGAVWFTSTNCGPDAIGGAVGRVGPDGSVNTFTAGITGNPISITAGPDGNMWFTERNGLIGRITRSGHATELRLRGIVEPWGIARGPSPDNHLWVADRSGTIESITTSGHVTSYTTGSKQPMEITAGPGHALWFTVPSGAPAIGKFVTPLCHVPRLVGGTLAAAITALNGAGCSLGRVRGGHGRPAKRLIVTGQDPAGGGLLARGAAISLRTRAKR